MANNRSANPAHAEPVVNRLTTACPFLFKNAEVNFEEGATCVFGDVARIVRERKLGPRESAAVFDFFNTLAENADPDALNVLAIGALETFNDDAYSQRLARQHLRGKALGLLEEMRVYWGQPNFCEGGKQ